MIVTFSRLALLYIRTIIFQIVVLSNPNFPDSLPVDYIVFGTHKASNSVINITASLLLTN